MCGGNPIFAILQVAAGKDSIFNWHPDFVPTLSGVFANRNRQGDLLAMGLVRVAVFPLDALKRARANNRSGVEIGASAFTALVFVAVLPLIGLRAGAIVAMIMLVGVLPRERLCRQCS